MLSRHSGPRRTTSSTPAPSSQASYNVGNRELLAVKVALEEWWHWVEGAEQPFLVWTDHKNLEYIRPAKRLNARQASGPFPLTVSRLPRPIALAPKMPDLMFCPACLTPTLHHAVLLCGGSSYMRV